MEYIAWQYAPAEEADALKRVFMAMDSDMDGKLSREDLEVNFRELLPTGLDDLTRIMDTMDCDGNGYIEFHEFLTATLNWKRLLTTEVMESAFRAFDKDGNGMIGVDELKFMLQGEQEVENGVWTDVYMLSCKSFQRLWTARCPARGRFRWGRSRIPYLDWSG